MTNVKKKKPLHKVKPTPIPPNPHNSNPTACLHPWLYSCRELHRWSRKLPTKQVLELVSLGEDPIEVDLSANGV